MVATPSWTLKSIPRQSHAFLVSLSTIILSRVLFASNLWMVLGDHALCCKKTQDTITRHNRVRNLMFKLGELGVLSPQMEKLGLLGPTDDSKRRPGDVSFANWRNGRGLAIDWQ